MTALARSLVTYNEVRSETTSALLRKPRLTSLGAAKMERSARHTLARTVLMALAALCVAAPVLGLGCAATFPVAGLGVFVWNSGKVFSERKVGRTAPIEHIMDRLYGLDFEGGRSIDDGRRWPKGSS